MRTLLRSLLALAGILLVTPDLSQAQGSRGVSVQRTETREVGARRVLIVGVDKYSDQRIPQLRYATVDAMAFAGWLRSPAAAARVDTMIILLNEQATKDAVLDTYRELVAETKENDELIVYFAGHGGVREVHNNQEGYLLPHDADSSNIARRGISLDDINKEVSYLPGQSPVLLILDACRSGNLFNSNLMSRAAASLGPNIRRLVSSEGAQDSQEGEQWEGHGAFTYFLLNGLYGMADGNDDGNVTLAELGMWVVDRVSSETNQQQIPQVQPFDHKWVIAGVNQEASDSVARRDAARPTARSVAARPTRGTAPSARPSASARPGSAPAAAARRGGELVLGQRASARLEASAPVLDDSTHFDTWTYRGRRGEKVAITMRSSTFDPYLILARDTPAGRQTLRSNDDGGGGTDAQISLQLPADGEYIILANAVAKTDLGDYTLEVQTVAQVEVGFNEIIARAAQLPMAAIGAVTRGALTDDSEILTDKTPFEAFAFEGRQGETVEIEMRTTNFDAYLAVGGVGVDSTLARDDDGGNLTDALVVVTLPRTGRYVVLANAIGRDARGDFELEVRRGPPVVRAQALLARPIPAGQRLRKGQQASGDLTRSSEAMEDHSLFQVYYYDGRANEKITVTMRSDEFDTYLTIGGTGALGMRTLWESDDDSGGGTDSRLTVTLPMDGTYAIIANAVFPKGRGPYTISVRDGNEVDLTAMTDKDVISQANTYPRVRMGQSVRGRLTDQSPILADDTPFQGYTLEGRAGQRIQIDMGTTAFDAYLTVGMVGTDSIIGRDDDSGEDTNARLTVTLPADGRYVIFANAIEKDARGEFTLEVGEARAAAPAPAGVTQTTSEILAIPVRADRRLRAGQTMSSRITSELPLMADRTPYELWYVEGRAGDRVTATMRSSDFDSFLHFGRVGGSGSLATDDDGGGNLDSQIQFTLPADGVYAIIANTVAADAAGAYTIQFTVGGGTPSPAPARPAAGTQTTAQILAAGVVSERRIVVGQPSVSRLESSHPKMADNTPYEAWYLEGRAGQRVTITMRSTDFDSFLHFGLRGASAVLETDDDSGGNLDSQISITLPSNGTYVIIANTVGADESGSYSIEVTTTMEDTENLDVLGLGAEWTGGWGWGELEFQKGQAVATPLTIEQVLARPMDRGRIVQAGQPAQSRLDATDLMLPDSSHFEAWYYQGRGGERITVTLRSGDFDAFVNLGRQGASAVIGSDDDSGGGTDAQLTLTLEDDGVFVIIANSLGAGETGAFTLSVEVGGGDAEIGGVQTMAQILGTPARSERRLVVGQSQVSRLTGALPRMSDDTPFEAWYFEGRAGQQLTVTMRSNDLDSYLHIGRAGDDASLASDDDSGGNLDAQISITLPANGLYVLIANTVGAEESGSYSIEVTDAGGEAAPSGGPMTTPQILALPSDASRRIAVGETRTGELSAADPRMADDTPFVAWYFQANAGERITITLRSTDFDSFLHLGELNADEGMETDDDSGGDLDAQISVTVPRTGTYVIIVNTVGADESGQYTLSVQRGK